MGWTATSGAALTSGMRAYLDVLAARLGFDLVATSGSREPSSQARAMLNKLKAKGESELYDVYADDALIKVLLSTPRTESAWTKVIETKGQRLSRHLWKGAVDLRSRTLSSSQVSKVEAAVKATGGRTLIEYDHIHVDLPAKYVAMTAAKTGATIALSVWLLGGVALTAALLISRRRKARQPAPRALPSPTPAPTTTPNPSRRRRGYTRRKRAAGRSRRRP